MKEPLSLSALGVPDARCNGPVAGSFLTRLPSLHGNAAVQMRALAKGACKSTAVVQRVNQTLWHQNLAPLLGDFPPKQGLQRYCRGEALLYAASGMALAPFGPGLSRCTERSVCWFGITGCGSGGGASLPSLLLRARLVGPAIFAPHMRYLPFGSGGGVLLGWYCPPTHGTYILEARLEWLATSTARILVEGANGPELLIRNGLVRGLSPGVHRLSSLTARPRGAPPARNVNNGCCRRPGWIAPNGQFLEEASDGHGYAVDVFLGGLERRCTGPALDCCPHEAFCASLTRRCTTDSTLRLSSQGAQPIAVQVDRVARLPLDLQPKACHRGSVEYWANGDGYWADSHSQSDHHAPAPFAPSGMPQEEMGHGRWVWASRRCVRKPLTRAAARRCLRKRGREWLHLHGDSVARDLYAAVSSFLGLPTLSREELKRRTNVAGERLHVATEATHEQSAANKRLRVSFGHNWNVLQTPAQLVKDLKMLAPDVLVMNFAFHHSPHSNRHDVWPALVAEWTRAWRDLGASNSTSALPAAIVHQRLGAMQGTRGGGPGVDLRLDDGELSKAVQPLNFSSLEFAQPQYSRFDSISDGIHTHVNSTTMLELVSQLLELVCFGK